MQCHHRHSTGYYTMLSKIENSHIPLWDKSTPFMDTICVPVEGGIQLLKWLKCKWVWPGNTTMAPWARGKNNNSHMTPSRQLRQLKKSNQLFLPRWDDCKTRKDTKYCLEKTWTHTTPPFSPNYGSNNKQWINYSRTTALERTVVEAIGGGGGGGSLIWF